MISELAQRILRIILEAKEPVPGKSLARRCDISLGTVRKEIGLINEEVACRGFRIESKASIGYSLFVEDHEKADPYIEQLRYIYGRTRHIGGQSALVQYLVRTCLCASGFLTVDHLCEELFCSRSTMMRNLEKVREEIRPFSLRLVKRSGSLKVEGNEWDLRQCLLYQHKLYNLALEDSGHKEYGFKTMFFMMDGMDRYNQVRKILIRGLKEQHDFTIPVMNFPKLVNYILLAASRRKWAPDCSFSEEQIQRAKDTAEYAFIKRVHKNLPEPIRSAFMECDFLGAAMLLLSFETQNFHLTPEDSWGGPVYERLRLETEILLDLWEKRIGISRESIGEESLRDFICFLYTLENRQMFHVYNDMEYLGFVRHKGIRTMDMCLCFAGFYEERHGVRLSRQDTLSAFYLFFHMTSRNTFCRPQRILVISRYGLYYAKALVAMIRQHYGREVENIEAREFCDIREDDFLDYDLWITDMRRKQTMELTSYALPTLSVDFSLGQNRFSAMDAYLWQITREEALKVLGPHHFHHTKLRDKEEVFGCLAGLYGESDEEQEAISRHLRENDLYIDMERNNGIVLLPIILWEKKGSRIEVLLNETEFLWNECRSRIFVCYTRGSSCEDNQVTNDILKRFVHGSAEMMEALLRSKGEEPLHILYPQELK